MDEISLDELIGNLQTYELKKNSQMKEKTKKDRGLTLKAMFKKLFKKAGKSIENGNNSKAQNNDQD